MPDEIAERIEEPLEWGDSRSSRILELVRVGLAAEGKMAEHEIYAPTSQEKAAVIRDAIEYYAEQEGYTD